MDGERGITHYQAYRPRPFTRGERESLTILFGGLTWKHERLVQGLFHNLNYRAEPLPNVVRDDLDAGKELVDVGACCPTTFVKGVQTIAHYVEKYSPEIIERKLAQRVQVSHYVLRRHSPSSQDLFLM